MRSQHLQLLNSQVEITTSTTQCNAEITSDKQVGQWLRVLTALPEYLGLISSTHVVSHDGL